MKSQNPKEIEQAIKLAYGSLMSHLPWTYLRSSEGVNFHKKCVREYAKIILILSNQYRVVKKKKKDDTKKVPTKTTGQENNPS